MGVTICKSCSLKDMQHVQTNGVRGKGEAILLNDRKSTF